ncbi:MAG: hypothetical protein NT040_10940 [Bacteroidetes bacterium]|nr:hypothetical protein [Bacteroidota bacterium]
MKFKLAIVLGATAILAIFVTGPAFSQEPAKKESHKTIVLKIVSDDNGKKTVIDTTMEMPDDQMMDSVHKVIDQVIMMNKGGNHPHVKILSMPQGFSYDYDMSSPPEGPMDLEDLEGIDFEGMDPCRDMESCDWERMAPGAGRRILRSGSHGQTLNDILGEIPMDRVISYSIKDRKNGKRIIIDLNDAPTFERQDRVIVIREPGRGQRSRNHSGDRQMKVRVQTTDSDEGMDSQQEEQDMQSVSPPPPPPPADHKKK